MSVKPSTDSKGIILSVGSNNDNNKKQMLLCSGESEGNLHVAICQRWTTSAATNAKNIPTSFNATGLGETTGRFHTLVAVHAKGSKATGTITLFFDGKQVGSFDSSVNSDSRPFKNGFQFCNAYGGMTEYLTDTVGLKSQEDNEAVAFLDMRFYTNTWTAAEAKLYSQLYPPREPYGVEEMTWTNAAGDGSFETLENWSSGKLPKPNDKVIIEVSEDTAVSVSGNYSFTSLTISGSGAVAFSGEGLISAKYVNAETGVGVTINDNVSPSASVDIAANSVVMVTGTRGPAFAVMGSGFLLLDPGEGNTYTMSGSNTKYSGEAVIMSGRVKFGDATSFGPIGRAAFIRVKGGATLDENGKTDGNYGSEKNKVILEEGAVLTADPGLADNKLSPITTITLEGDAVVTGNDKYVTISRHFNYDYTHINLNGHTLTKTGSASFFVSACDVTGAGMIDVQEGSFRVTHDYNGNKPGKCPDATIRIGPNATFVFENYYGKAASFSVRNLILDGSLSRNSGFDHMLTVTGSITGSGTAQMLTMAEGAVFKPDGEGYLNISEVLEGTMTIDTGDLNMNSRKVPLPLFKVGSSELLPAQDDIAFAGGAVPKGWKLYPLKDEYGYELKRVGFAIYFK